MPPTKRSSSLAVATAGGAKSGDRKRLRAAERSAARQTTSDAKEEEVELPLIRRKGVASGDDLVGISRRLHDRLKGVRVRASLILLWRLVTGDCCCWVIVCRPTS